MKHRPNISVQQKSNTKLEYLKYLAEENIQPNIAADTYVAPKGKTKSKPKPLIPNPRQKPLNPKP